MRIKQLRRGANVQAVLGICYGKVKTRHLRGYLKVVGQNFWYLISENKYLYTDIIEPIGYQARQHDAAFQLQKSGIINRFTRAFIERFCDDQGSINWANWSNRSVGIMIWMDTCHEGCETEKPRRVLE